MPQRAPYEPVDVERIHRAHPDTFNLPSERDRVGTGHFVKLMIRPRGGRRAERMWVEVTSAGRGGFRGELRNDPVEPSLRRSGLAFGSHVRFGRRHVMDISDGCPTKRSVLGAAVDRVSQDLGRLLDGF